MSYSRWSNSRYHTLWDADSPPSGRGGQIFSICGVRDFCYDELKYDRSWCLDLVGALDKDASAEDLRKLSGHMDLFLVDVESEVDE
jgi:hypothetical protein